MAMPELPIGRLQPCGCDCNTGSNFSMVDMIYRNNARLNELIREFNTDDTVNIKIYGAAGDGVQDDTPAIFRAISDAQANAYSAIYFPKGTYRVTQRIDLPSGIDIIGSGEDTVFKVEHDDYLFYARGTMLERNIISSPYDTTVVEYNGDYVLWTRFPLKVGQLVTMYNNNGTWTTSNTDCNVAVVRLVLPDGSGNYHAWLSIQPNALPYQMITVHQPTKNSFIGFNINDSNTKEHAIRVDFGVDSVISNVLIQLYPSLYTIDTAVYRNSYNVSMSNINHGVTILGCTQVSIKDSVLNNLVKLDYYNDYASLYINNAYFNIENCYFEMGGNVRVGLRINSLKYGNIINCTFKNTRVYLLGSYDITVDKCTFDYFMIRNSTIENMNVLYCSAMSTMSISNCYFNHQRGNYTLESLPTVIFIASRTKVLESIDVIDIRVVNNNVTADYAHILRVEGVTVPSLNYIAGNNFRIRNTSSLNVETGVYAFVLEVPRPDSSTTVIFSNNYCLGAVRIIASLITCIGNTMEFSNTHGLSIMQSDVLLRYIISNNIIREPKGSCIHLVQGIVTSGAYRHILISNNQLLDPWRERNQDIIVAERTYIYNTITATNIQIQNNECFTDVNKSNYGYNLYINGADNIVYVFNNTFNGYRTFSDIQSYIGALNYSTAVRQGRSTHMVYETVRNMIPDTNEFTNGSICWLPTPITADAGQIRMGWLKVDGFWRNLYYFTSAYGTYNDGTRTYVINVS